MREDSPEPSRSPWSTPTESEIYEAHKSALSKEKDAAFKELGLKVKTPIPNKKNTKNYIRFGKLLILANYILSSISSSSLSSP